MSLRVTIWNEGRHEQLHKEVQDVYPDRIDGAIAKGLETEDFELERVTLDDPEQGLPDALLDQTDVLLWWGHMAHDDVNDDLVSRVQQRVLKGMGLVVLHSGHHSKLFQRMMGTNCNLSWREQENGEIERVWTVLPSHPIAEGLDPYFELPQSEMYGEPFDIPTPDEIVFMSWFEGGEVFRSGCTYRRGRGKIFYFSPGHETFPIYFDSNVMRVIRNAIHWAHEPHKDGRQLENWHRPQPM